MGSFSREKGAAICDLLRSNFHACCVPRNLPGRCRCSLCWAFFFFFLISIPLQSHRETSIAGVALKMSSSMTGFSSFSWMLVSGIDGELPPLPTHTNLLFIALFHFLFAPQPPSPNTPLPSPPTFRHLHSIFKGTPCSSVSETIRSVRGVNSSPQGHTLSPAQVVNTEKKTNTNSGDLDWSLLLFWLISLSLSLSLYIYIYISYAFLVPPLICWGPFPLLTCQGPPCRTTDLLRPSLSRHWSVETLFVPLPICWSPPCPTTDLLKPSLSHRWSVEAPLGPPLICGGPPCPISDLSRPSLSYHWSVEALLVTLLKCEVRKLIQKK